MKYAIELCSISWIKADPHPVTFAAEAEYWKPDWIPKVIVGLVATRNSRPRGVISDVKAFRQTKDFRAMTYVKVTVETGNDAIIDVRIDANSFIDPGYTPPFRKLTFPTTFLRALVVSSPAMDDPTYHAGELASLSGICARKRHANSVIPVGTGEAVVFDSLCKFRAGPITDARGVSEEVGSPNHVPWVWTEMLLTYRKGGFFSLYAQGSKFPTHNWFLNGKEVLGNAELADISFPHNGRSIIENALNLYPALTTGMPAGNEQISSDEVAKGPVGSHRFTMGSLNSALVHRFKL